VLKSGAQESGTLMRTAMRRSSSHANSMSPSYALDRRNLVCISRVVRSVMI
jgi:hypothetical protein